MPFARCRRPAVLVVVLALLTVGATAGAVAPPAAPDQRGPFSVGHESFVVVDPVRREVHAGVERARSLPVDVWYPITPQAEIGSVAFYPLQVLGLGFNSSSAREGAATIPNVARPLIVFSHGSGGISVQSTALCEMLASHGFIVAAPNHIGNTAADVFFNSSFPTSVSARNRPLDVSLLIDRMIARSRDANDRFHRTVNASQIGVAGHSFGGFTTLAVAAGFAEIPPDRRVKAILPIAPATGFLSDALLANIAIPVFVLGGTQDTTTPVEPNSRRAFERPVSRRVYRADIVPAGHSHFASVCKLADVLRSYNAPTSFILDYVPGYEETCSEGSYPIEDAERIQNLYAVSFFKRHLMQDSRYEPFLESSYAAVMEPDVTFTRRNTTFPLFWQQFLESMQGPQ